jgi:hypothetical protein
MRNWSLPNFRHDPFKFQGRAYSNAAHWHAASLGISESGAAAGPGFKFKFGLQVVDRFEMFGETMKAFSSRWNTGTCSWKQPARDPWTRMCGPFQVSVSARSGTDPGG